MAGTRKGWNGYHVHSVAPSRWLHPSVCFLQRRPSQPKFARPILLRHRLHPIHVPLLILNRIHYQHLHGVSTTGGGARAQADRRLPYGGPSGFGPSLRSHPFISRSQDSQHRLLMFRAKKLTCVSIVHNIFILIFLQKGVS